MILQLLQTRTQEPVWIKLESISSIHVYLEKTVVVLNNGTMYAVEESPTAVFDKMNAISK